ncbi:Rv3235 family protein [Curtobacterium luteum]|uniref:Rv3235 family protein n=1 Tax=Curtobacterium luteum TaxID=33881 RepID=UPI00380014AD
MARGAVQRDDEGQDRAETVVEPTLHLVARGADRPARPLAEGQPRVAADVQPLVAALPDPRQTARALALCVVEILSGAREVDSIARWVTEDVHRHLQQRAAVAARNRSATRHPRRRPALRAGSVVACSPADGVFEATVVVHGRSHARAVAIRLEVRNARWRATAVGVL